MFWKRKISRTLQKVNKNIVPTQQNSNKIQEQKEI